MVKTQQEQAKARQQTADRKEEEARERAEHMAAYNASRKKGYVPNRETILAQIEALYADSKISIQEYEWGMKGLPQVHDIVADGIKAEAEADPKAESQEDLPF